MNAQPLMPDIMETISLRTLLREPLKVKRMTRAGKAVQVTDNGRPVGFFTPLTARTLARRIDKILDEVLREQPSKISAARLLTDHAGESRAEKGVRFSPQGKALLGFDKAWSQIFLAAYFKPWSSRSTTQRGGARRGVFPPPVHPDPLFRVVKKHPFQCGVVALGVAPDRFADILAFNER